MLLVLERELDAEDEEALAATLIASGAVVQPFARGEVHLLSLQVPPPCLDEAALAALPGVARVVPTGESYLASRAFSPGDSVLPLGRGVWVGGEAFLLAAGPCAVESADQIEACAAAAAAAGAKVLRGGSFKPRTSPYSFQGLGDEGLRLHRDAADRHGLLVMSEVLDREDLPRVAAVADILQVGSRNMQNFPLLRALGRQEKPVLLKRGLAATREEFLLAAEYILAGGNGSVLLCERGVRSFDPALRHTLDLGSVVLLKSMTHLPVLVDPSHAVGRRDLVLPMARAAAAAGADGLVLEVHPTPGEALSDGPQALLPPDLLSLRADLDRILPVVGKRLGGDR